jgi:hypothetical protein
MHTPEGAPGSATRSFRRRRWILRFLPPALLVLLPTVLVLSAAGSGFTLWGSDMVLGSYHIRGLVGRQLREGRFPVWDPHTMCGFPILAAMQGGILYPPTWLAAFLSPGPFWTTTVLLHLILGGLFAFGWLRKGLGVGALGATVGAFLFMLSGYYLSRVLGGHISQICSYPWIAAVFWRTEVLLQRPSLRSWILLAGAVALLFLPGFPQFPHLVAILMLIRVVAFQIRAGRPGWRTTVAAAGAGLAGVLFCAPQLLATLELLPEAQRVTGGSYDFAAQLSVPLHGLIGLVVPSFFGDEAGFPYWGPGGIWEASGFVGIAGLLLGALALRGEHPQRWFWAVAAGIALLLVLGKEGPLFRMFYEVVPGVRLFRPPGRYFSVFTFALTALSAAGVDRLWKERSGVRTSARQAGIAAAAIVVSLLAVLALWQEAAPGNPSLWNGFVAARLADPDVNVLDQDRQDPGFPGRARVHARGGLVRAASTLGLSAVVLLACAWGRLSGKAGACVLGTILIAELASFGHGFMRPYDPMLISWPKDFVDVVKGSPGYPFRLVARGDRNMVRVGKCQVTGLDNVGGYESMILRRYSELINAVQGRSPELLSMVATAEEPHPVFDMLGVKLWLVAPGTPAPRGWRAIGVLNEGDGSSLLLESPGAFPRAFCVPEAVAIPSREDRLRFLVNPATDLKRFVVLESLPVPVPGGGSGGAAVATVTAFAAGEYAIRTESQSDGYLVLTETWYPGWEARVDGAPVEILRANHFVQAIRLPAGRHSVRFAYHSRWLGLGFLISAGVLAGILGTALLRRRAGQR